MQDPTLDLAALARRLIGEDSVRVAHVRIGIDVVDVAVLARQLRADSGPRFLARIFTEGELKESRSEPARLAARWAAKEAVAKAVGSGFRGLEPRMIEITKTPNGQPSPHAVGDRPWPDMAHLWRWEISMAHDSTVAIAVAIGCKQPPSQAGVMSTL
jgi:holo-[acyl-carrier protein] synthase